MTWLSRKSVSGRRASQWHQGTRLTTRGWPCTGFLAAEQPRRRGVQAEGSTGSLVAWPAWKHSVEGAATKALPCIPRCLTCSISGHSFLRKALASSSSSVRNSERFTRLSRLPSLAAEIRWRPFGSVCKAGASAKCRTLNHTVEGLDVT